MWISVHEEVIGSKLRKLSKDLGCSKAEALGLLVYLWIWGIKNADREGLIKNADKEDLEEIVILCSNLEPQSAVNILIADEWIDEVDGELFFHDWSDWQSLWYKYLDGKAKDKARKVEARRKNVNPYEGYRTEELD